MKVFLNYILPQGQWSLKRIIILFVLLGILDLLVIYLK